MSCFRTFIALALFLGASSAFAQVGEISDKRDAPKASLVATQSFDGATNTPSDAPTLLDVVKAEAAQMDVFPQAVFLHRVVQPLPAIRSYFLHADFYKDSPFFHPFYEGDLLLGRGLCYDLTFEEYLVFYRFKTAACYAAPQEIDECVAKFDEMSPKERALVLTAIQLWREAQINSRFVRSTQNFLETRDDRGSLPHLAMVSAPSLYPCVQVGEQVFLPGDYATPDLQSILGSDNWPDRSRFVRKKYSRSWKELKGDEPVAAWKAFKRWQCEQVPRYIIRNGCLLPVDVPEFTVDAATEERWNRLIESCVESEEIAFEQLDLDLEETKRAWEADCRERLAEVGELFNVELPEWHVAQRFKKPDSTIYYSYAERFFERDKLNVGGDELRYWEALTAFFDAVEAQKKAEPQSEATRRAVALQEFWFACQRTAPVGDETPKDGLQSARPLTLGEIAKDCLPLQTPARQELRRQEPREFSKILEEFSKIIEAF